MKFKNSCRVYSIITLLFLISNIGLPSAISAATLYCNIEISSNEEPGQASSVNLDYNDSCYQVTAHTTDDCSLQQVCEQSITNSPKNVQAIPQNSKDVIEAGVAGELFAVFRDRQPTLRFTHEICCRTTLQFKVLNRSNGELAPHEQGWKDTVLVNAGEKVRVLVKFDAPEGMYVFHCHNLEHANNGMMANFEVV